MTELVIASNFPAPVQQAGLLEAFLEGRKPTTLKAYRGDLLDFSRRIYSTSDVALALDLFCSISGGNANGLVLTYRHQLQAAKLASATIARRLAALRSITKLGRMLGKMTWIIEVESPKAEPRRDVRGPTKEERKKLWKVVNAKASGPKIRRDRAIIALLFGLALRRGEVVSLDLADIDLDGETVAVVGKGKTEKLLMPLSKEVSQSIEAWISVRGRDPGPLFTRLNRGPSNDRLTGETILNITAGYGSKAGLTRKLRPHGLRHAAITSAFSVGLTPKEVKDLSRHAKFETLLGYDDAINSATAKVAKAIGRELSSK